MNRRMVWQAIPALAAILVFTPGHAQTDVDYGHRSRAATVVAIAPDGNWGVATDPFINNAISEAIASCKIKYRRDIGCGYQLATVHGGWSLLLRCGDENILVSARTLEAAEQAAIDREYALRQEYARNMPGCVRVLSVNPDGVAVAPDASHLLRVVEDRNNVPRR